MPSSPPPRSLACRLARLRAALTDRRPPHADACPACREYFAREERLDQALARDSRALANAPAPEGLETWILAGIRSRPPIGRRSPARPSMRVRGYVVAGACAAALVAMVLFVRDPSPDRTTAPGPELASEESLRPEELAQVVAAVEALPQRLGGAVAPTATRFVESNPLLGEVDLLYADARAALGFLAMNFLPPDESGADPSNGENGDQPSMSG